MNALYSVCTVVVVLLFSLTSVCPACSLPHALLEYPSSRTCSRDSWPRTITMPLRPEGERATKRARPQITRLHDAVRRYDVQAVKELMAGGAKLEADNFGRTALHLACSAASQGRSAVQDAVVLEMVTAMLSGADTSPPPLCLHCDGLTPLHLAARYGSSKLMSVLLSMCAALTRPSRHATRRSSHARDSRSQRRRRGDPRRARHEDPPHRRAVRRQLGQER